MKNKLVIFDCFGVIFEEVAPTFLKKFLAEDKALIIKEELFVPADLGKTLDTAVSYAGGATAMTFVKDKEAGDVITVDIPDDAKVLVVYWHDWDDAEAAPVYIKPESITFVKDGAEAPNPGDSEDAEDAETTTPGGATDSEDAENAGNGGASEDAENAGNGGARYLPSLQE